MNETVAQAAAVAGGLGVLALMLGTGRRPRLAGSVATVGGAVALAVTLAPGGHRGELSGAAVLGLILAALVAVVLVKRPWILPFAALAAAPIRIHVTVGEARGDLLLPLYVLAAAVALALFWELSSELRRPRELGAIAVPLGLWVAWSCLSVLWAADVRAAAVHAVLVVLPLGVLAVGVARLHWSRAGAALLSAQLAAMGVLLAAIGGIQWLTRDDVWRPLVLDEQSIAPTAQAHGILPDAGLHARFLVVAIVVCLVVAVSPTGLRVRLLAASALGAIWAGLYVAYSQWSLATLLVGTLVAAVVPFGRRGAVALAVVATVAVAVGAATPRLRVELSDRVAPVGPGFRIALDHPVAGVGAGGFPRAYRARQHEPPRRPGSRAAAAELAAETGFVGVLLAAWALAEGLISAFRRAGSAAVGAAGAAVGVALTVVAVHAAGSGFLFDDPMTWLLLGFAAVAARARTVAR